MCSTAFFVFAVVILTGLTENEAMPAAPKIVEWPSECEGRSYCATKPSNYPDDIFEALLNDVNMKIHPSGGMENRSGDVGLQDVASCLTNRFVSQLFMIKDENDEIRLVAQTKSFQMNIQIEECKRPGRTMRSKDLKTPLLKENRVDCYETKVPMQFLVLSLDGTKLESVVPKEGIPSSCSAKLMKDQ